LCWTRSVPPAVAGGVSDQRAKLLLILSPNG